MAKDYTEYNFLKQEIRENQNTVQMYRNILYVSMGAILTFAFSSQEPLAFLIPFIVIIPTYMMSMGKTRNFCKIGAYLAVFLESDEGTEVSWETRLHRHDILFSSKKSQVSHYTFCSTCCFFLSIWSCISSLDIKTVLNVGLDVTELIFLCIRLVLAIVIYFSTLLVVRNI